MKYSKTAIYQKVRYRSLQLQLLTMKTLTFHMMDIKW